MSCRPSARCSEVEHGSGVLDDAFVLRDDESGSLSPASADRIRHRAIGSAARSGTVTP